MTLFKEQLKRFREKFTYENDELDIVIRYALCQNPKTLHKELESFFKESQQEIIDAILAEMEGKDHGEASHHCLCLDTALQDLSNWLKEGMK